MKKILLLGAAALSFGWQASAAKNVSAENRTVAAFDKIITSGIDELLLRQGSTDSVVVEVAAKWQKEVRAEVNKDGTLLLWMPPQMRDKIYSRVFVTCKNLAKLHVSESKKVVSSTAIKADSLYVRIAHVGSVALTLNVNRGKMRIAQTQGVTLTGRAQQLLIKDRDNDWFNTKNLQGEVYSVNDF